MSASFHLNEGEIFHTTNEMGERRQYKILQFLGGGATSRVYKAEEVDQKGNEIPREPVDGLDAQTGYLALKVLKSAGDWRGSFEDEIDVLHSLWREENRLGDGLHLVPYLYDYSASDATPAFLAMEYVSHPTVDTFAYPSRNLLVRIRRAMDNVDNLIADAGGIQTQVVSDVDDEEIVEELKEVLENVQVSQQGMAEGLQDSYSTLQNWLDGDGAGLEEKEISQIGAQMCRLLQLLHKLGRSYKDFQLKNVHWDRDKQQIKVIDWNVVTKKGRVDIRWGEGLELIETDLARLSSYLFWLRTLVRGPEEGASVRTLEQLGGLRWSEYTSLGLRRVLEKALHPNKEKRYKQAYDFFGAPGELTPLRAYDSLGEALDVIERWHKESVMGLIALAGKFKDKNEMLEASALIEIVYERLDQEPAGLRGNLKKVLEKLQEEITEIAERSLVAQGRRQLEIYKPKDAVKLLRKAVHEAPDDLEAHRWLAVAQALQEQSFWDEDQLDVVMRFLHGRYWKSAAISMDEFAAETGVELEVVKADALFGLSMAEAEQRWRHLQQLLTKGANDTELMEVAGRLGEVLTQAQKVRDEHPTHPYLDRLSELWPQQEQWSRQADILVRSIGPGGRIKDEIDLGEMEGWVTDRSPVLALEGVEVLLQNAKTPQIARELKRWRRELQAYLDLQQFLAILEGIDASGDVESQRKRLEALSGELLHTLKNAHPLIQEAAAMDVAERFENAYQLKQITEAKRLATLEQLLLAEQAPDRSDRLQKLEQALDVELEDRKQALLSRIQTLEAEEDYQEALRIVEIILGGGERQHWGEKEWSRLESKQESLTKQVQEKKLLEQVEQAEQDGDRLFHELTAVKLEEAVKQYRRAKDILNHNKDVLVDEALLARIETKREWTDSLHSQGLEIENNIAGIRSSLAEITKLIDKGYLEKAKQSSHLYQMRALLGEFRTMFYGAVLVPLTFDALSDLVFATIKKLKLTEKEFSALGALPELNWAESVLQGPVPDSIDSLDLNRLQFALKDEEKKGKITPEIASRWSDRIEEWVLGDCGFMVNAVQTEEFLKAQAAIPRLLQLYSIDYQIQGGAPSDSPPQAVPALAELKTAGLLHWLRQFPPEEARNKLEKWVAAPYKNKLLTHNQVGERLGGIETSSKGAASTLGAVKSGVDSTAKELLQAKERDVASAENMQKVTAGVAGLISSVGLIDHQVNNVAAKTLEDVKRGVDSNIASLRDVEERDETSEKQMDMTLERLEGAKKQLESIVNVGQASLEGLQGTKDEVLAGQKELKKEVERGIDVAQASQKKLVDEMGKYRESIAQIENNVQDMMRRFSIGEESAAVGEEPVVVGEEPVAVDEEPVAVGEEPVVVDEESAAVDEELVAVGEESVAVDEEPVAVDEESAAVGEEPVVVDEAERKWWQKGRQKLQDWRWQIAAAVGWLAFIVLLLCMAFGVCGSTLPVPPPSPTTTPTTDSTEIPTPTPTTPVPQPIISQLHVQPTEVVSLIAVETPIALTLNVFDSLVTPMPTDSAIQVSWADGEAGGALTTDENGEVLVGEDGSAQIGFIPGDVAGEYTLVLEAGKEHELRIPISLADHSGLQLSAKSQQNQSAPGEQIVYDVELSAGEKLIIPPLTVKCQLPEGVSFDEVEQNNKYVESEHAVVWEIGSWPENPPWTGALTVTVPEDQEGDVGKMTCTLSDAGQKERQLTESGTVSLQSRQKVQVEAARPEMILGDEAANVITVTVTSAGEPISDATVTFTAEPKWTAELLNTDMDSGDTSMVIPTTVEIAELFEQELEDTTEPLVITLSAETDDGEGEVKINLVLVVGTIFGLTPDQGVALKDEPDALKNASNPNGATQIGRFVNNDSLYVLSVNADADHYYVIGDPQKNKNNSDRQGMIDGWVSIDYVKISDALKNKVPKTQP